MLAHLTTVHPREDTRIRFREVGALVSTGIPVTLFVQDGKGSVSEIESDVRIMDTGPVSGKRLARMTIGAWRMYRAVRVERPAVAHFHDPELIPVGLALKFSRIKVIYDVHEDVPQQLLTKQWISPFVRHPASWFVAAWEWLAGRAFDGIVAAEPHVARRFPARKTVTVHNFPILSELTDRNSMPYQERPPHFAYVGGVTRVRGSYEMMAALEILKTDSVRLKVAGEFQTESHSRDIRELKGWEKVDFHGWANRRQVAKLLSGVRAGLVILHPIGNYLDAYPVKMFEYMAAGIPVIASNFPLWREIIESAGCGLLVDPLDSAAIADAMQWLLDHPDEAEAMGRRGRAAAEAKYNWEPEALKLINFYDELLGSGGIRQRQGDD